MGGIHLHLRHLAKPADLELHLFPHERAKRLCLKKAAEPQHDQPVDRRFAVLFGHSAAGCGAGCLHLLGKARGLEFFFVDTDEDDVGRPQRLDLLAVWMTTMVSTF